MNCSPESGGLAVVVVTHQSGSTLDACLQRARAAIGVTEIRVVDNASSDQTMAIVQRHALADARLRFVGNPDNPGFSVACNQGAGESHAPWLAFVNPDLLLEADTLARMRALAAPLGDCILGADLVDLDGVRDPAARRRDPDFAAMLAAPWAASRLGLEVEDQAVLQPVQAISGALMLVPRALFERIGGFDPGYRLHAEDLDLCRRARQAGAVVAVANQVRVVHERGVSARAQPLFVEWHKHRGLARYYRRFEAPGRSWPVGLAVHAGIALRFLRVAARILLR